MFFIDFSKNTWTYHKHIFSIELQVVISGGNNSKILRFSLKETVISPNAFHPPKKRNFKMLSKQGTYVKFQKLLIP